jgi:2-iminoacetate synthase ThiH
VSWVKMGPKLAQLGLMSGANDFGGTLMEESISRAAGSEFGDNLSVEEIERYVREIGRSPWERTTTYERRERERPEARPEPLPMAGPAHGAASFSGY